MGEMTDMGELHFTKGHGTENDFVLLPDPDGGLEVTAGQVRAICDRHAGLEVQHARARAGRRDHNGFGSRLRRRR